MENAERLAEPGILIVANHPTLIDAVALMGRMPKATVVTKTGNQTNFFMGGTIRGAGYIANDDAEAMVASCAKRLADGYSLLLFPEGTRSPKGALGPFQRGAARVAIEAKRDILPAIITCDPPTLMKDQPWWDVPDGPFEYSIRLGAPISVAPYVEAIEAGAPRSRIARQLTAELRETFEKSLGLHVRP